MTQKPMNMREKARRSCFHMFMSSLEIFREATDNGPMG